MKYSTNNVVKKDRKSNYFYILADTIKFTGEENSTITLNDYFSKSNIPCKYRKIFFREDSFEKVTEYVTNIKFNVGGLGKIALYMNGNSIFGNTDHIFTISEDEYEQCVLDDLYINPYDLCISFEDIYRKANYKFILNFYKELESKNLLKDYIKSVTSFFSEGMYYNNINKINQRLDIEIEYILEK